MDFENVNLIFGSNGSGKSTFAALFEEYSTRSDEVGPVRVEILDAADQPQVLTAVDDYFWPGVRVFNREYVARSIRFDGAAGPNATALLTLGEREVEAEVRRGEIQQRLEAIATEQGPFQRELDSSKRGLDRLITRSAQQIGQELQAGGARFNPRTYRAPSVRALIEDREALAANASTDIDHDLATVVMPAMEEITHTGSTVTDLPALSSRLGPLLARTITSVPLPELQGNPAAERWVQGGLPLHEGAESCLFCGEPLHADRRAALARHFDASLVALQRDLAAFRSQVVDAVDGARASLAALPAAGLLLEPLRPEYEAGVTACTEALTSYLEYAEALTHAVDAKTENLFSVVVPPELPIAPSLGFEATSAALSSHNRQLSELARTKSDAASRVESARVLAIVPEVDNYRTSLDANQGELDRLAGERQALIDERDSLPTSDLDPLPLATSLNNDLAYLLGRDELKFTVSGERYEIQRSGEPAKHLSEGERTAISLLYFLSSLGGHDVDPARLTVVIDDPVSSLDSSVLVGASSHLWSRLVEATATRQVFILTHNFDLFRMWSNQFDRRSRAHRRARSAAMFEMRMKATSVDGAPRRVPVLSEWPTDADIRKRIRSEYHYLFWRLAHTLEECRANPSVESDIDAAAVLPNVARRVLEGFLAFKYPEMIDNFEGAVTRANENADPATQQRIVRFLHQYSHNGEADTGRGVPRPESVTVLTAVFDLMRAIDPGHLSSMCRALDIDEAEVTTPAAAA